MMVECSLSRRSNTRTEPSAETEAKTPTPPQAMSKTSRSCAISCVSTMPRSTSQMVQVVSMDAVPSLRASASFQSNEVSGAQNSECLLLLRSLSSLVRGRPGQRRRRLPLPLPWPSSSSS